MSIDTCQTNYTIHSKLRISTLFLSHTWKSNLQAYKRLKKGAAKQLCIQLDAFVFPFIFFIPMPQTISIIKRSGACYFLYASN